jgi:hypothetical protein
MKQQLLRFVGCIFSVAYLLSGGILMVAGWVTYCGLESVAPTLSPPVLDGTTFLAGAAGLLLLLIGVVARLAGARWFLGIALLVVVLLVGKTFPEFGWLPTDEARDASIGVSAEAYWILFGCTTLLLVLGLTTRKCRIFFGQLR